MKSWKHKLIGIVLTLGLLVSLIFLVAMPATASPGNAIYFNPDPAVVTGCSESIDVKLIAEIDVGNPVIAALITFTFDNTCLQITSAARNSVDWKGGVTIPDLDKVNASGGMTISTTVGMNPGITGVIEVATLTLYCINCEECTTLLDLTKGEYITEQTEAIDAELNDGSFTFSPPPDYPTTSSPQSPPPSSTDEPTKVQLDGLITTNDLKVDQNGIVQEACQLWRLPENVYLDIGKGTKLVDAQGNILGSLSASKVDAPPAPSSQLTIVCCYDFGPDGTTFEPEATLNIGYDPASLSGEMSEDELYIAYWDGERWVALESTVDAEVDIIQTGIRHFTQFAVVGELKSTSTPKSTLAELTAPAGFTLSDLSITPRQVKPAEQVTISALVTNTGGSEGSYTVVLRLNGVEETRKVVAISAGQSKTVTFSIAKDTEGTYTVNIGGKAGQFTVTASAKPVPPTQPAPSAPATSPAPPLPPIPPTPPEAPLVNKLIADYGLIGSIAAGCVVCAVVVGLLLFSFRRR